MQKKKKNAVEDEENKPANEFSKKVSFSDTPVPEPPANENRGNVATEVGRHQRPTNRKKGNKTAENSVAKPTRQPVKKKIQTGDDATKTTRKSQRYTLPVNYNEKRVRNY